MKPEHRQIVSTVALAILAFIGGAFVTFFDAFPFPQLLEPPFQALEAELVRYRNTNFPASSQQWNPACSSNTGVSTHQTNKTYDGLTLYTSSHEPAARLVDMHGDEVYRWERPFDEVWPDPPHISRPVDASAVRWRNAHLFDDGSLLVNFTADGVTPYGYGLAKLDRQSKVVWRYDGRTHHDFSIQPDGSIWTLTHRFRDTGASPVPGLPGRDDPILEDFAVKLDADGREIERLSLVDALARSDFRRTLRDWFDAGVDWDVLHANDVDVVDAEFARHHDFARAGQLLVSLRSLNALALVDPDEKRVVWATRGPWVRQHDPDMQPDGTILLYDNKGHGGPGGGARLLEFDPSDGRVTWSYTGTKKQPFRSIWGGKQTRLPNGNILATEPVCGRIVEVTPSGDVAWRFHNPERRNLSGRPHVPALGDRAERVPREAFEFLLE